MAKLDGYPWWPGMCIEQNGSDFEIGILFFGSKTTRARVRVDRVKSYHHFPDYLSQKQKDKKITQYQVNSRNI